MPKILRKSGMGKIHGNPEKYWEYQQRFAREKLIPLLNSWGVELKGKKVLEVGCGDGGIIHAFAEAGSICAGVEINEIRVQNSKPYRNVDLPIFIGDFCQTDILEEIKGPWDVILLRDVLEHLLDKNTAMSNILKILADNGTVFFDFCPWYMPYGGHQQVLDSFLKFVPFLHWLPRSFYAKLIYWSEKDRRKVFDALMDTYDSQITLKEFYHLLDTYDMHMEKNQLYVINPSYEIKFGIPEVKLGSLSKIPIVPEIFASNIYALARRNSSK